MNDKARQRHDVTMQLGILVQPIADLANADTPAPISEYRIACAKVQAGYSPWCDSVRKLASYAPDIVMEREHAIICTVVRRFLSGVNDQIYGAAKSKDTAKLHVACREKIREMMDNFYECLSAIPVEWEPEIFAANTPFTSYLKIKDTISNGPSENTLL